MKDLNGKVALVTGGAHGIGRAIAIALADAGAHVALHDRSSDGPASELVELLTTQKSVRCHAYPADIADETAVIAMVDKIEADFGRIDILVNNASITRDKSFLNMSRAMWDEVLGVNLNGPFNVTNAVLRNMVVLGWGRIVNIASMGAPSNNFSQGSYTVTKGGLIAFTMTLARELARKGITVNAVSPGYTAADMTSALPENLPEHVRQMIPMGRLGEPEEIAAAVAFLASPRASYITGQVMGVNGGMYI